jgi:beta-lactamase regulating signal transducer with metallopeptidase domain
MESSPPVSEIAGMPATTSLPRQQFLPPASNARPNRNSTPVQTETALIPRQTPPLPAKASLAWSWPVLVFAVWLSGVLLLAGHVISSSFRLRRRCAPLPPSVQVWADETLRECCARLQLQRPPALLESFEVSSPALHGLFHPRLLLPVGFTTRFSPTELCFVFLHELAHLKRRDLLTNWLIVILQVMHWFNPLVWFGFARWRAERELACDAMALEAAGEGQNKEYGRTILRLLDNFSRPHAAPGLVGILEDKSQLQRRIGMIASYVPTRGWPRLAMALIFALAVIGLTDAQTGSSSTIHPLANPSAPTTAMISNTPQEETRPTTESQIVLNTPPPQPKGPDMTISSVTNQIVQAATVALLAVTPITTSAAPAGESISAAVATAPAALPDATAHSTLATAPVALPVESASVIASTTPVAAPANAPPAASADSDLATQLIGAWILVGKTDHVGKAPSSGGRIKFFTGDHWCMTQSDPKTGVVLFNHGGAYTLDGNTYHESVDYAGSSTIDRVGNKGNYTIKIDGDTLTSVGVGNPWNEVWKRLKPKDAKSVPASLTGTWAYAGKPGQTNPPSVNPNQLKFCAGGYWCDVQIDPKTSVVTIHHGGSCALKGDKYIETCLYANPTSMPLIGEDVKFNIQSMDDTFSLTGLNNSWKEIWKKLN